MFLIVSLESPFLTKVDLNFYPPDICLICVIYLGATSSSLAGVIFSMLLGFLKDSFALGIPMGMFAEIYVIIFIVSFLLSKKVRLSSIGPLLAFSFILNICAILLFFLFSFAFFKGFAEYEIIFKAMIPHSFLTMLFSPIFFHIFIWIDKKVKFKMEKGLIL